EPAAVRPFCLPCIVPHEWASAALHVLRQSVDQRALHTVVPQSVRTTNARCTALATLHHRSTSSHLDRRLPSIEFNIQHRAARALHLTAIGEQKIMPLAYMSSRLSPSYGKRSTLTPPLCSKTVNVRTWTAGDYGFDPSLRIFDARIRLSECQTITQKSRTQTAFAKGAGHIREVFSSPFREHVCRPDRPVRIAAE
ncbi:hypothetical protein, partial [Pseudomonas savastanoi]|uniref:hypothetical protein n=3 Tax=Pseudomonas savastanoi TaxID=29438 RepID=UPI001F211FFB